MPNKQQSTPELNYAKQTAILTKALYFAKQTAVNHTALYYAKQTAVNLTAALYYAKQTWKVSIYISDHRGLNPSFNYILKGLDTLALSLIKGAGTLAWLLQF